MVPISCMGNLSRLCPVNSLNIFIIMFLKTCHYHKFNVAHLYWFYLQFSNWAAVWAEYGSECFILPCEQVICTVKRGVMHRKLKKVQKQLDWLQLSSVLFEDGLNSWSLVVGRDSAIYYKSRLQSCCTSG